MSVVAGAADAGAALDRILRGNYQQAADAWAQIRLDDAIVIETTSKSFAVQFRKERPKVEQQLERMAAVTAFLKDTAWEISRRGSRCGARHRPDAPSLPPQRPPAGHGFFARVPSTGGLR